MLINRASDGSGVCHHCQLVLRQPGCHQIFVVRVGLDTHIQGHLLLLVHVRLLPVVLMTLLLSALMVRCVNNFLGAASRALNDSTTNFFQVSLTFLLIKVALSPDWQRRLVASSHLLRHEAIRNDHSRQHAALGDFLSTNAN